jgi:hypothetical protein
MIDHAEYSSDRSDTKSLPSQQPHGVSFFVGDLAIHHRWTPSPGGEWWSTVSRITTSGTEVERVALSL